MKQNVSDEECLSRYQESLERFCDPPKKSHFQLPPGHEMNGQQSDCLIREVVRRSEKILCLDDTAPATQKDWDPSSWVFSFTPQFHTGGRSGMGGRPSGTTVDIRRHFASLVYSVFSSRLLMFNEEGVINLTDFVHQRAIARLRFIHSQGLRSLFANNFATLPGNMLGVYAKFTVRDSLVGNKNEPEIAIANPRDRHLLCAWIDRQGKVGCSCIGNAMFTAKVSIESFSIPCCVHAKTLYSFFQSLLPSSSVDRTHDCLKIISSLSVALAQRLPNPKSFMGFNVNVVLLTYRDSADCGSAGEQWVPIRVNKKRRGNFTCAFCDTRTEKNCAHILEWRRCQEIGFHDHSQLGDREDLVLSEEDLFMSSHLDEEYYEDQPGRSYLPLGPINCRKAVQVDNYLRAYTKRGGQTGSDPPVFVVPAPRKCYKCGLHRDELSRKDLGEGIISCTSGPVRMRMESFRCSNIECGALIYEEGRSKQIIFFSFTSATTHAFMRREIQAVVLSEGTISNRFSNYLRNRLEDRYSGVVQKKALLREIKRLTNLFALTVKLMVIDPSPRLFTCSKCAVQKGNRLPAVCLDGIWAGYNRESTRALVSLSEKCDPISPGRATFHHARPNTGIFRTETVASVIALGMKGDKKDIATERTLQATLSALRVVEPQLIPDNWDVQAVFSHVQGGREMDELLSAFRETTFVIFRRNTIAHRIARSMSQHIEKRINRLDSQVNASNRKSRKRNQRYKLSESDLLSSPIVVHRILSLAQQENNPMPVHNLAGVMSRSPFS